MPGNAAITAAMRKRPEKPIGTISCNNIAVPHNYDEKKECRNKQQRSEKPHRWRQGLTPDPHPEYVIVETIYYSD
jgi:hypothetical protein